MNRDRRPDPDAQPGPGREQRSYPHGSGDRNSWSPFGHDRMPQHEGGSQRRAPPDGEETADDGERTDEDDT